MSQLSTLSSGSDGVGWGVALAPAVENVLVDPESNYLPTTRWRCKSQNERRMN